MIDQNSFATLISHGDGEPEVSHTPILLDRKKEVLQGHLSKGNPHHKRLVEAKKVWAIFHGPHHYISPNFYNNHPSVPTWNYAVVHISGIPSVISDRDAVVKFLGDLVEINESQRETPWEFDLPPAYLDKMLESVVCFKIAIKEIRAKFKLSQNRPKDDLPSIIEHLEKLEKNDGIEVAKLMINNVLRKK